MYHYQHITWYWRLKKTASASIVWYKTHIVHTIEQSWIQYISALSWNSSPQQHVMPYLQGQNSVRKWSKQVTSFAGNENNIYQHQHLKNIQFCQMSVQQVHTHDSLIYSKNLKIPWESPLESDHSSILVCVISCIEQASYNISSVWVQGQDWIEECNAEVCILCWLPNSGW